MDMEATGPKGFSKSVMTMQPSDSISLLCEVLCTWGSIRRHRAGWCSGHTSVRESGKKAWQACSHSRLKNRDTGFVTLCGLWL